MLHVHSETAYLLSKNFETKNPNLTKLGCYRFYLSQGENQFRLKKTYNTITQPRNLHCGQQWYYKDKCNLYDSLTKVKMQPKGKKKYNFLGRVNTVLVFYKYVLLPTTFRPLDPNFSRILDLGRRKNTLSKGTSLVQNFEAWKV